MATNVGTIDRALRVLLGLALIALALGLFGAQSQTTLGWIGVIPLATGIFGTCPVYSMLGLDTCKRV